MYILLDSYKNYSEKSLITDSELIKINTSVLNMNDCLVSFTIKLNDEKEIATGHNTTFTFHTLESNVNRLKKDYKEKYRHMLFDHARECLKSNEEYKNGGFKNDKNN